MYYILVQNDGIYVRKYIYTFSMSAGIPYQSYQAVALIYKNISDNLPIYSFWHFYILVVIVQRTLADSHGKSCALFVLQNYMWNVHPFCLLSVTVCYNLLKWREITNGPAKAKLFFFLFEFCLITFAPRLSYITGKMFCVECFGCICFWSCYLFHISMSRSKHTLIKFSTIINSILSTLSIWNLVFHFDKVICSLPSMQRSLHKLSGDGVPDRPSGYCKSHFWDTGCRFSTYCHHCALQGVFTRRHADRQPEEVSL